jgi:UDP-glucose 4-epimerase
MKIIVTGGAGFIGSHVVDRYIQLGHEVVVIDNLSTGSEKNLNPAAKFYHIDICSEQIYSIFANEKPDIINHHAAQISVPLSVKNPFLDLDYNARGFLNILEACVKNKIEKVIFISSGGAIYGEATEYPTSENYYPTPLSPYAIHKYISEVYLKYYHVAFGLNYTILRYANVYGPRQISTSEAGVVSIFIETLQQKQKPYLFAYPESPDGMLRDYVYVRDIVRANELALSKPTLLPINIGTGIETSTGTLLREICKQMKVPYDPINAGPRPGDIRQSCLDISRASDILDWTPQFDLTQGISETIRFFSPLQAGGD